MISQAVSILLTEIVPVTDGQDMQVFFIQILITSITYLSSNIALQTVTISTLVYM